MNEFLRSFPLSDARTPFHISLAGITYPDASYHLKIAVREISVIEYVISGKGYVLIDGEYRTVEEDTIYFLSRGEQHEYFADKKEPFTKIFLNISGSVAKELSSLYGLGNTHIFRNKSLRPVFERIPEILRSSENEEQMQIELQLILVEILTKLSYQKSNTQISHEVTKLKNYIDENDDRIISNAELSEVIFRSVDYCQKLFLQELGITPYAYQINRKIMIAKNLLTNTDMSVGTIGASLGYSDPHYFSNIFKTKTGQSPMKYRKQKTDIG